MGDKRGANPALARLQAQVRIGGKGSVRRKKKVVHKTTTTDDKRLQNTLKRLGTTPSQPSRRSTSSWTLAKLFTSPTLRSKHPLPPTYVIIGVAETKKLQDLFPGILNQVDKSVLPSLKKIAEQYNPDAQEDDDDDDDDEVPIS